MCPQETIGLYQSRLAISPGKPISLSVCVKILGKGCDWPSLDHVLIPKPMTEEARLRALVGREWVTDSSLLPGGEGTVIASPNGTIENRGGAVLQRKADVMIRRRG